MMACAPNSQLQTTIDQQLLGLLPKDKLKALFNCCIVTGNWEGMPVEHVAVSGYAVNITS
jgi:hypothetical protein